MTQTGVRSGILLAVIGLWLIMRSTRQDQSGRTLIDHILGKKSSLKTPSTSSSPSPTAPAPAAASSPAAGAFTAPPGAGTLTSTPPAGPASAPATGPAQGVNVAPAALAQIQGSLDKLAAMGF